MVVEPNVGTARLVVQELHVGAGVLVSCDHVGNNICSWTIWEVTFFIEIMVDKYDRVKEGFKC